VTVRKIENEDARIMDDANTVKPPCISILL